MFKQTALTHAGDGLRRSALLSSLTDFSVEVEDVEELRRECEEKLEAWSFIAGRLEYEVGLPPRIVDAGIV